ncbi:MAG TPA: hypothetical protein VH143_01400 [Kofleriaceae bacterium]|nr:hypothetical protein [Kofleriaceae bacterium]
MFERVRIPGVPSPIARADGALVFTDRDRSTYVDLTAWPPQLVTRDEYTLHAARSPNGAWLAHVRRNDLWSLRWYASIDAAAPLRDEPEPVPPRDFVPLLGALDAVSLRIERAHTHRLEGVHCLGEHALVVPRHVGFGTLHHPFIERETGWVEALQLPAFVKTRARDRCPTACVRLADGSDVLIWNGHAFCAGALWSSHRLQLAWHHDHAPVAFGERAMLACDDGKLVELDGDRVTARLPGVTAYGVQRGPNGTFIVETNSVPIWWSPTDDWACELAPDLLGKRGKVVGIAAGGGLVAYDSREYELVHITADALAKLPRRKASEPRAIPPRPPLVALDALGAASSRARIAGVGEQLVTCSDHALRLHVGDHAAGIERWASPIVAVAHDGRHVAAIDTRGTVRILRGADAGGPISVRVAGVPRALVAGPDSTWLAIVAQGAWIVDEQKLARGARPEPIALPGAVAAAVDPDGTVLFLAERAGIAVWRDGTLVELPATIEQLVACAPLGRGRFLCAGERHLFAFDVATAELELLQQREAFATVGAPHVAASPSGQLVAWTATPISIDVARLHGTAIDIVQTIFYADEYSQPLDTRLAIHGLAFTDETTLAIALDEGRGNLVDLATRKARRLDPQLGDAASRWILFVGDQVLVAE